MAAVPAKTNMVVGALGGRTFAREALGLRPGEALILYTDGVTEAFDEADTLYGEERMDRRLAALPPQAPVAEIVRGIVADVAAFSGAQEQSDDITLLVLRRDPDGGGPR